MKIYVLGANMGLLKAFDNRQDAEKYLSDNKEKYENTNSSILAVEVIRHDDRNKCIYCKDDSIEEQSGHVHPRFLCKHPDVLKEHWNGTFCFIKDSTKMGCKRYTEAEL